ncbi:MAG TPA: rhomboid family intramembrane serine protease [Dehalococcoidia bacterium]|jgi:membrane associated rhomboid family serine protease|nr:rhomboid family intramembrane serine protease [Dehalococcoidia bacterium]
MRAGYYVVRYRRYPGFGLSPILVLVIINFLVFIATMVFGELVYLLGLQPVGFLSRPWTILTSMFVHAGLWHIFANMLTLYFFGSYLARLVGNGKFLLVYFGGGILGGILFVLLAFPFSVAVGASGAVFALAGALVVMRPRLPVVVFPIPIPIPLWVAVIGGFLLLSFLPLVAWQAHLGGLVFGLIAGYIFRRRERYFVFRL